MRVSIPSREITVAHRLPAFLYTILIIFSCFTVYSTESLAFQRTDVNPSYAFLAKRPRLRTPELYEFTVCMHVNVGTEECAGF